MRALARALVRLTAPPDRAEAMVGDLEEEHHARRRRDGRARAALWYWGQALRSAAPNVGERVRRRRGRRDRAGAADAPRAAERTATEVDVMGTLLQDARYGLRSVLRHPAFGGTVVLTLALGIAANATIFAVVDGLILDPFPFPEPERVVGVGSVHPRLGGDVGFFENLSPAEYMDVRDGARTLESVVAWDMGNRQIDGDGPPENVFTAFWWGDPLATVGMRAHLGRSFSEDELRTRAPVAMLSHRIWSTRFGSDSSMVGDAISINDEPYTLVGIAPEGVLIYGTDLWTTMWADPVEFARNRRQFQLLGRVAAGADLDAVNAELETIARRVEADHGAEFEEYGGWRMEARTWAAVNSATFRQAGLFLMAAVGLVLLLVCANVANLLLARSARRRREVAVRSALGAGRWRLVRQLLTESAVLAVLGGAAGLALAVLGVAGVQAFLDSLGIPFIAGRAEVDGTVVGFTALVAVVAGALFGLIPALQTASPGAGGRLRSGGSGASGGAPRVRLQRAFVGLETALALALLAAGGLLVRSLVELARVDPGVAADEVLSMRLTLPVGDYDAEGIRVFFERLTEGVEGVPGVQGAAAATQIPPMGFARREVEIEGAVPDAEGSLPTALTTVVTDGFFETVGTPMVLGRAFGARDEQGAPMVTVINRSAARRFFGEGDPVGRRLRLAGGDGPWFTVVGVVGDTRNRGLDADPQPEIFAAQAQLGGGNQLFMLVRVAPGVDPHGLLPAVRREVAALDADQPVYAIQTLASAFRGEGGARRATAIFLFLFAGFALLLAATGVWAVVAYSVGERTREIGVRVALGAAPARVRRMVLGQALLPVALGSVVGLALAAGLGRAMQGMLYGVGAGDPTTLAAVTALMLAVAAGASWLPARRATRLDPSEALRAD